VKDFSTSRKRVEAITGEKIHALAERLVFEPFEMVRSRVRSSFIWDWRFDLNRAYPHDPFGRPALGGNPGEGNAAWSLQTTAADFASFLLAILDGSRLQSETARLWLHPHIEIKHPGVQCLETSGMILTFGTHSFAVMPVKSGTLPEPTRKKRWESSVRFVRLAMETR
jgi:CubicO group peptidase (beta-lactamase class C family)